MKHKTFEAVKFMREIRDELSRKYLKDPQTQDKDLIQIRKKYHKLRSNNSKKISKIFMLQCKNEYYIQQKTLRSEGF